MPQVYHKFPVYSKLNEDGKVISKIVQCNNCNVIHKVNDLCRSEILGGKDELIINLSLDDLSIQLPQRLANILIKNNCNRATFEHAIDVIEEERWGEAIILSRQIIDDKQHIKMIEILSIDRYKLNNKLIEDEIILSEEVEWK